MIQLLGEESQEPNDLSAERLESQDVWGKLGWSMIMVRHGATQCRTNDSDTRCGKTWKNNDIDAEDAGSQRQREWVAGLLQGHFCQRDRFHVHCESEK